MCCCWRRGGDADGRSRDGERGGVGEASAVAGSGGRAAAAAGPSSFRCGDACRPSTTGPPESYQSDDPFGARSGGPYCCYLSMTFDTVVAVAAVVHPRCRRRPTPKVLPDKKKEKHENTLSQTPFPGISENL